MVPVGFPPEPKSSPEPVIRNNGRFIKHKVSFNEAQITCLNTVRFSACSRRRSFLKNVQIGYSRTHLNVGNMFDWSESVQWQTRAGFFADSKCSSHYLSPHVLKYGRKISRWVGSFFQTSFANLTRKRNRMDQDSNSQPLRRKLVFTTRKNHL